MQGQEYWRRERELCSQMLVTGRAGAIDRAGGEPGFSIEDVHATSGGKSFDYRACPTLPLCPSKSVAKMTQILLCCICGTALLFECGGRSAWSRAVGSGDRTGFPCADLRLGPEWLLRSQRGLALCVALF